MFLRISTLSGLVGLFFVSACAGAGTHVHAESSANVETDLKAGDEEENLPKPNAKAESSNEEDDDSQADTDEGAEPQEAVLARAALHRSSPPENHLGLAMVVSERASDLPWVLAIENRSPHPIKLAALPQLLSAEITPPDEGKDQKETKEPQPTRCGGKKLPKSLEKSETVELKPGELIFHAFDPRELCGGEAPLQEGAQVKLIYGFPTQTKKLWRKGKLETVEIEQTAPFVAERQQAEGDEIIPLKHLMSEEFTLNETYPLSAVTALPEETVGSQETTATPPPLQLSIAPLGTSKSPESKVVEVRVKNTSGKKMQLFLRRELFTYQVMGPSGATTCKMHPAGRHPDPAAFSTLSPGESRTLQTRLAEACPSDTWDEPGAYAVAALFESTASGAEHGLNGFTGTAMTRSPARLVVPGDNSKRPMMRIVPSRPRQSSAPQQ